MAITDGKYPMRAVGEVVLGTSSEKKTPFIEFYLEIEDGENKGGRARFTGYFGPNSSERTIEALQTCGWEGDDLSEFSDGKLHGLEKNKVQGVVELEEYEDKDTQEKRTSPRVQFINRLGGYLNVQNAMTPDAAASFGERMKGLVLKTRAKVPNAAEAAKGDFPHGANAPESEQKKTGTGGKKAW